jgi:formylmethanofuran dehydrogenase subunit E
MEELKKMPLKRLENFVKGRENFYSGIVNLVDKASSFVKPTSVNEQDFNTEVVTELKNFYGFDVTYHTGQSQMGGNLITIKKNGKTVLELYYQAGGDLPKVERESENRNWESDMKKLLKNPAETLKSYRKLVGKLQKPEKEKHSKEEEEYDKKQKLLDKAEEMKITLVPKKS